MWTGRLASSFVFDGAPVEVETSVHPDRDLVIVRLQSKLLADGRLGVDLKFPGVVAKLNPDPADWANPEKHSTREVARGADGLTLARQLDDTRYSVRVAADRELDIATPARACVSADRAGASRAHLVSGVLAAARRRAQMPAPRPRATPWRRAGKTTGCTAASWISPAAAIRARKSSSGAS